MTRRGRWIRDRWIRGQWLRVLIGLLVGAAVGVVVYQAGQLSGRSLFVAAGATAGGVAALMIQAYTSGSARLTDVTVTVPQLSELHFVLTRDTQHVAWRLFNQLSTRVATRALDPGTGVLREALTSLYTLFITTREITDQVRPSRHIGQEPTVEHLALAMLNNELAPFLSRWHSELSRWEKSQPDQPEDAWPFNDECRSALAALQRRLYQYVLGFGRLAGMNDQTIEVLLTGQPVGVASASPRPRQPRVT